MSDATTNRLVQSYDALVDEALWVRFAATVLEHGGSVRGAACEADDMLAEVRKRRPRPEQGKLDFGPMTTTPAPTPTAKENDRAQ